MTKSKKRSTAKVSTRAAKRHGRGGYSGSTPKAYVSAPLPVSSLDFQRADIEFDGIDHAGASYEAMVFVNNPTANAQTPPLAEHGYAGAFHIFGHGGCFGDVGHCDVRMRRQYDPRPAHPLTPARKVVIATDAIRRAIGAQVGPVTVTVVPVVTGATEKCDLVNVLSFEKVTLVTYR
jgi:hypothetical protein